MNIGDALPISQSSSATALAKSDLEQERVISYQQEKKLAEKNNLNESFDDGGYDEMSHMIKMADDKLQEVVNNDKDHKQDILRNVM